MTEVIVEEAYVFEFSKKRESSSVLLNKTISLEDSDTEEQEPSYRWQQQSENIGLDFNMKKKKKKKPKISEPEIQEKQKLEPREDYTYEEMLTRLYSLMPKEKVDLLNSGKRERITIPPPAIARYGGSRIAIMNFSKISKSINRENEHIQKFFVSEMSISSSSIDSNGVLIMKCKLKQEQIEKLLKQYIQKYVRCWSCKGLNTDFTKKDRQLYTLCNNCNSLVSVSEKRMI